MIVEEISGWFEKSITLTLLIENGMAPEGSGEHLYHRDSLLGKYVNNISKTHDWLNSDASRYIGFEGYSHETGLWLQGSESYNTLFQAYSSVGMLPAAGYTSLAMAQSYEYIYYMNKNR